MTVETAARCRRTTAIERALLDGTASSGERAHAAGCMACGAVAARIARFDLRLAVVVANVEAAIPDRRVAQPERRWRGTVSRLRLAPAAALTSAVAVGLLIAAVIGARPVPSTGDVAGPFLGADAAASGLAPDGLVCADIDGGVRCQSTAPDHVHRITLDVEGGRVVEVEVRIEATDGGPLDLRGVPEFLGRIAGTLATPGVAADVQGWIDEAYPTCRPTCSTELDAATVTLFREPDSISLVLRAR
jgi:hypothetical protein